MLEINDYSVFAVAMAVFVAAFGWGFYSLSRAPSQQELLLSKKRLEHAVTYWRYPGGDYVPQHKRMRLMRELRRVCRQLESAG